MNRGPEDSSSSSSSRRGRSERRAAAHQPRAVPQVRYDTRHPTAATRSDEVRYKEYVLSSAGRVGRCRWWTGVSYPFLHCSYVTSLFVGDSSCLNAFPFVLCRCRCRCRYHRCKGTTGVKMWGAWVLYKSRPRLHASTTVSMWGVTRYC